ncbi:MAG TPA: GNAT family N-acetyltransferase [Pyrinomonadaceae bacterium]|nr:GNAT family N-acetyltransferase [Pyrinomonadaceae bacterium]
MDHHSITPFSPRHYPAFTALWNQAYPDLQRTELEMRLADMSPAQPATKRWVVEKNDVAVGFGGYEPSEQSLQLHLFVAPEWRRRGIGSRLYDQIVTTVDDAVLSAWIREDRVESLRFLEARGFVAGMRTFHSSLDTTRFDLARLERYHQRLRKYGYEFANFAELESDPQRNRATYELYGEVLQDIPSPEPGRLTSFAEYEERILKSPELFRAQFFALHHGSYVGLCILLPHGRAKRELYADTLGIRRTYRGRGIAQALSYLGIEYAIKHGYPLISADSFVGNQKINVLLERLGFGNRTVWTLYSKSL